MKNNKKIAILGLLTFAFVTNIQALTRVEYNKLKAEFEKIMKDPINKDPDEVYKLIHKIEVSEVYSREAIPMAKKYTTALKDYYRDITGKTVDNGQKLWKLAKELGRIAIDKTGKSATDLLTDLNQFAVGGKYSAGLGAESKGFTVMKKVEEIR